MEKKVLFTASTYSHIVHFHLPYLREFARLGWRVDVACGGQPMDIPAARQVIRLPLEKSMTAPANFSAAAQLRKVLRRERYDLIITHTALAAFFTRLAATGVPCKLICVCHGYLFDEDTPRLRHNILMEAEHLTAPRTDLLLTMNAADLRTARRFGLGKRIASIPGMGVDFPALDAQAGGGPALQKDLGLTGEDFVLLYPAEFSQRKSQATLIRAMPLLPDRVKLLLPGQGALLKSCQDLARRLRVDHRVIYPGQAGGMGAWYAAADCAVTASRSEGLPFNVMEAMHAGLPVVATAVKGHTDLLREGESGLFFPYGDQQALALALRRLLHRPDLCRALGTEGQRSVEPYGLDWVLPQVMAAYGEVVEL